MPELPRCAGRGQFREGLRQRDLSYRLNSQLTPVFGAVMVLEAGAVFTLFFFGEIAPKVDADQD